MKKTRIALSLGDPAGISYEISVKAVNSLKNQGICGLNFFGDKAVFAKYKRFIKHSNYEFVPTSDIGKDLKVGKPSKTAGIIAAKAIIAAAKFCLSGKADALVTAPVSKESLKLAGIKYPGHTEFLANITKSKEVAMMMVCGKINSVMVTRHLSISQVAKNLKTQEIIKTIKLAAQQLKLKNNKIRIVLCSLNPHAGDNGILGNEEKTIIMPAVKKLNKIGFKTMLMPADSAWLKTLKGEFDLICGMYHDQIMIPLKCINAKKIVNVTAGLPFIRTSPGHGTAYDIAGKNKADYSAMKEAIVFAAKTCK